MSRSLTHLPTQKMLTWRMESNSALAETIYCGTFCYKSQRVHVSVLYLCSGHDLPYLHQHIAEIDRYGSYL